MIFDKELRAEVKIQRNAIYGLLNCHLPKYDLIKIGDSEIQITWSSSNYSIRSTSLECNMYGDWQFVEMQDECNDNYYYSQDLKLDYKSPANDIVNALMKLL